MTKFRTNQTLVNSGFNQASGGTLTLCGNNVIANSATFRYESDMSNTYTARSIVDAEYVTGHTVNIRNIGSNQQIIYRDVSGITGAIGFIYNKATSGVTVPNLCISTTPAIQAGNYFLLTWDSGTTKINKISALSIIQGGALIRNVFNISASPYVVTSSDFYIGAQGADIIQLVSNINGQVIVVDDICGNAAVGCEIQISGVFFGCAAIAYINTAYGSMTFIYNGAKAKWSSIGFSTAPY